MKNTNNTVYRSIVVHYKHYLPKNLEYALFRENVSIIFQGIKPYAHGIFMKRAEVLVYPEASREKSEQKFQKILQTVLKAQKESPDNIILAHAP